MQTSWILLFFMQIALVLRGLEAVTHWRVTELGRIEQKDDSPFTLLRPYDLVTFMQQMSRAERLEKLKKLIISKEISTEESTDQTNSAATSYQEKFYSSDPDCQKAGQELSKFSFFETYLNSWHTQGFDLPIDVLRIKRSSIKTFKKPHCRSTEMPFSMRTYDHFECIQSKESIKMSPDAALVQNLLLDPEQYFGHLVHLALLTNKTSWIFLTMASEYFRAAGDFPNAVDCLQKAIYYSPKAFVNIPRLSLSNMLHKLNFINESLSVMLSDIGDNWENSLFSYYIANIYLTLGDLKLALVWYDRASRLDPDFEMSQLKKHAIACHIKLEAFLENQHDNLQKKLVQLKDYQSYSEEWFQVSSKFELEKSGPSRREFTKNFYHNFRTNTKSSICEWDKNNETICQQLNVHYSYFPFEVENVPRTIAAMIAKEQNAVMAGQVSEERCDTEECDDEETSQITNESRSPEAQTSDEFLENFLKEKNIRLRVWPPSSNDQDDQDNDHNVDEILNDEN